MWILSDWLQEYHPKHSIESGECCLQSFRLFGEEKEPSLSTVYLCETTSFIETAKTGVMCVNRNDYIYLETSDIIEVFNKIIQAFDYYNTWENEMEELAATGKNLQELITASSPVFRNVLIVGDAAYRILALDPDTGKFVKNEKLYRHLQEYQSLSVHEMSLVNREQMKRRTYRMPYLLRDDHLPGTDGVIRNLFAHGKSRFGMMILKEEKGFTNGEIQLFDRLGEFLEKWLKKHVDAHAVPALHQLFIELICQDYMDLDKHLELLEGNGWGQEGEKRLVLIEPCQKLGGELNYLENYYMSAFKDSYAFYFGSGIVLLIRQPDFNELKRHLIMSRCFCGVSYPFTSLADLKNHYEAASVALRYGSRTAGAVNFCSDYVLPYVKDIIKKHALCDLSLPVLERLKTYDRRYGTDYYHTLYIYLINERNKEKTSRDLHVHRNTVLHRLDKIGEIIQMDLNIPKNRFELLLSYLMNTDNPTALKKI